MKIVVEKTGAIARSIAYQATAISGELELVAMFGSTEQRAKWALLDELRKLQGEIESLMNSSDWQV